MATLMQNLRQGINRRGTRQAQVAAPAVAKAKRPVTPAVDIAPNDPIVAYFLSAPGVVEIDKLEMDSPALSALKAAGVKIAVPLVGQGDLVGLLSLGPRLSEQDYSTDDRRLLSNLATQAAPAVRVAQLVQQQQAEVRERERMEQELRVARLIQQTLLPKEVPVIDGWQLAAYYQPARAVGGDFYDFIPFEDGRLGLVIGDVTDKGVPAALVMATTRSILRGAAKQSSSPGEILEQANDLLYPDIPPKMFVTCLYALLDPATGRLLYANAGHDLPYRRHGSQVEELRATGMPLGLMPGMRYDEKEIVLEPGERVLFYSDGLVEAHNPKREMFSFPHLRDLVAQPTGSDTSLIDFLLDELHRFTGDGWEQEDDVTLVTLERAAVTKDEGRRTKDEGRTTEDGQKLVKSSTGNRQPTTDNLVRQLTTDNEHTTDDCQDGSVARFEVASEAGNERVAMERVGEAAGRLGLGEARLENLKTAVAEATMNAMEHGNGYRSEAPVALEVCASQGAIHVRITDQGGGRPIPDTEAPDLEAKLAGLQMPRGWGLFLIKNLVDEMRVISDDSHHTIELIMYLGGDNHAS
jgi:serine phosphatase RsbU (regulator of sigma subunit)/anti-sigma regulatory factor (Ser/Thr protein kinase)